jgi:hypothetical protein
MWERLAMTYWGTPLDARALEAYAADLRQFADVRISTLEDGMQRGTRIADVHTAAGLAFTVLLDRAMDIGSASFRGIPLAWQSGTGAANPNRYEAQGTGWLRTFHGGLLALCGLTQAGHIPDPPIDPTTGETLGLHGRVGAIPARDVGVTRGFEAGEYVLRLHGVIDEVALFSHKLRLTRTLEVRATQPEIRISDRVYNFGGLPAPLMVLYHCNFGYPLLSPDTEMFSTAAQVRPRDAAAQGGIANWQAMHAPVAGYAEQVFWHDLDTAQPEMRAGLRNPRLGIGVEMVWSPAQLGYLTQWKQLGFGDYTVGIEPANCRPIGRVAAREAGELAVLGPGETAAFDLTVRVHTL